MPNLPRPNQYPCRHIIADRSRVKFKLQQSQYIVLLYSWSHLSAIIEASLLYTTIPVVPMLPDVEKANAMVKGPHSISLIHSSYVLLSLVYLNYSIEMGWSFNNFVQKNFLTSPPETPCHNA